MGMFSRQEKSKIPPVQQQPREPISRATDGASNPRSAYQQQYQRNQYQQQQQPPYSSSPGPMRSQGRGPPPGGPQGRYQQRPGMDPRLEDQRRKLYAGVKAPTDNGIDMDNLQSAVDGPPQQLEEEDEIENIKQEMRFAKQETVASSRNALNVALRAEETAARTLDLLGDQSERIAESMSNLDTSKAISTRAEDQAAEIKRLNRSIFRPSFTFNKEAKRRAKEQELVERHIREKEERLQTRKEAADARENVNRAFHDAARSHEKKQQKGLGGKGSLSETSKLAGRAKYQFEATESDDEMEDEIEKNMDELSLVSKRLNILAKGAGKQIQAQNEVLSNMEDKVDKLDVRLVSNTQRLATIK